MLLMQEPVLNGYELDRGVTLDAHSVPPTLCVRRRYAAVWRTLTHERSGVSETPLSNPGAPWCRGYNIGIRLIDEFLAKSKTARCGDFRETADKVAKASTHAPLLPAQLSGSIVICNAMRWYAQSRSHVEVLIAFVRYPGLCSPLILSYRSFCINDCYPCSDN